MSSFPSIYHQSCHDLSEIPAKAGLSSHSRGLIFSTPWYTSSNFEVVEIFQPLPFFPKPGSGSCSLSGFLVFKNYFNIIIHYVKSSFVKNLMWFLFSTWDPDCYISCTSHPWPCGLLGLPWAGIFLCLSIWFVLANGVWLDVICATSDKADTFKILHF